jgi:hypothetical protein
MVFKNKKYIEVPLSRLVTNWTYNKNFQIMMLCPIKLNCTATVYK